MSNTAAAASDATSVERRREKEIEQQIYIYTYMYVCMYVCVPTNNLQWILYSLILEENMMMMMMMMSCNAALRSVVL